MGISTVAGRTGRSGQFTISTSTLAEPEPACSGTRTGPWKVSPQHRCFNKNLRRGGDWPALAGYVIVTAR